MVGRQDEQALDWYRGRQSIVPVQSVLHERHYYFDDDVGQRHRGCELFGMNGPECVLGGRRRSGGVGVVDTQTGRLVVSTATESLAREIVVLCNEDRRKGVGPSNEGRYIVQTQVRRTTGMTRIVLRDTKRRTVEGEAFSVCWIYVDPNDLDATHAGERLLKHFASQLDVMPLDWNSMHRAQADQSQR
ncbi:hypothetical protein [Sphingomonas sp. UYP23]